MKLFRNKIRILAVAIFSSVFLLPVESHAAQIQGVTVSAVSGEYQKLNTSTPDRRYATNLVGSTGLFGDVGTYTPQGAEWLDTTAPSAGSFVTFDLGAVHQVDAMKVWNFNQNGSVNNLNNCVQSAFIAYSLDGVSFTTNYTGADGQYHLAKAPGTFSAFAETISANMGFSARYVRINIQSNYTATGITGTVGLSKVRFIDDSVPLAVQTATENYGGNQVTVQFAESVDPASATNTANYSIATNGVADPGVILSAEMGEFNDRVILHTAPLTDQNYSVTVSGVYDQALTTPPSTNVVIQPELILWLKADAGVQTDDSGNVTQWNDQSGYGHNALTNLAVNQYFEPPTLVPGAVNGLPAVNFNGTQLLNVPHDANLAINGDVTVCLVLDKTTSAAGDPISKTGGEGIPYTGTPQHGYTNNLPAPFDYQITSAQKSSWTWGNGAGGAPPTLVSSGAFVLNQYYIVMVTMHGTNAEWYLNGSFNGSGILGVAPADQGTPIMLGVRADSGNFGDNGLTFAGDIAEAMVIRGTLTPEDLVNINNYLGQKYNIPIATLAITEQPQNVTAQIGKTATFWVNAVGVPPLKYQWKTNNVDIGGATSAIYTTPPLTAADDSLQYSVAITTPVGATNSDAATLAVVNDITSPTVFSATKTVDGTGVMVTYSEAVDPTTALNPANYTLNNGVSVSSAAYGSDASNSIVLTTSTLEPDAAYYLTVQNVQDLFGNAMTTATAPVLPASLSLYLRGDSGVVLDGSGRVDQWLDQTTNGNNAVQFLGGAGARPATGDTINNEPVLRFDSASSNYLQAAASPALAITSDMTIYAVANFSDYSTPREILGKTAGNLAAPYDYYVPNSTTVRFYRGNGSANSLVTASTAPSAGTPHVLAVTMAGTSVSHFLDGAGNGSGSLATTIGDSGTPLLIGGRGDFSANWMNGDLGEIMIFSSALSGSDRTNVDNYLGVKYSPFTISQQPQPVNTDEGTTATFAVAASQGSAHLNYQWQENSTNIPGATGASYTTPVLALNDNGETFTVQMVIPGVSTNTSDPATLSVNADNAPPTVTSAGRPIWNTGSNSIVVLFSEAVEPATATATGNYSLDHGANVLSAVIGDTPNQVVLTTSVLNPGTSYTLTVQNVKDLYNNTMLTALVPSGVYPPATALWVRADAGVVTDAGTNAVNEWDDQSGNGNNLVNSYGSPYEPQLVTDAINGLPVIRFTATNNTFLAANSSPTLAITGDMSVFAVMNFATLAGNTNAMILSKNIANLPAPYDYYVRPGQVQFYRGDGTVNGYVNSTGVPSTGVPHLLDVVMQGTAVTHQLDGMANGSGTIATTIADGGNPLYIGTRIDGAVHLTGDMAELIVIGSAVSTNDFASIENYLGAKYNLPIGPSPTISLAPAGNQLIITYTGTLLSSTNVAGPYSPVGGAASPYAASPTSSQMFYRTSNP